MTTHDTMKTAATATSSGLSVIGALYILCRYWHARRRMAKASTTQIVHHLDVTKELVHVLAWFDLVGAVGRMFGVLPAHTFEGDDVSAVCKLQAFVIEFGDVSPIAWNFVMALNLFRWVCLGEDQQMLQRKIKWYILATLAFTISIAVLALAYNHYGDAGLWCWITLPHNHREELFWKLGCLYIWVLLGGLSMTVLLVMVKIDMKKRLAGYENEEARAAYDGVVRNLTIYISAFIVCWLPAVVDRGYYAITSHENFTLSMLHASIVPLQGFVNAVIYGKFHVWIGRHVNGGSQRDKSSSMRRRKSEEFLRLTEVRERERHHFGSAAIFLTTFDMNWNAIPPNLEDWVPPGKDVYVFSLQHCIAVQHVEQSIRKHLLRVNYPMSYRSITSLAGSAFRGHTQDASVCQIVFVNNADVASGNFIFHAGDGRMWSQRNTFKEVVGIPVRYFDASISFVSCNLSTATPHPHNLQHYQDLTVSAKNHLASSLIHSFGMDADRADVDFPYLYHHTFLAGNFNYDIDLPKQMLSSAIDQAFKAESLRRVTSNAIETNLKAMGGNLSSANPVRNTFQHVTSDGTFVHRAQKHGNVPVEWNLLFFKSRNSLGRSSNVSVSSDDGGIENGEYAEVYSSCHDNVPFTLVRSPHATSIPTLSPSRNPYSPNSSFVSSSSCADLTTTTVPEADEGLISVSVVTVDEEEEDNRSEGDDSRQSWFDFLDSLFPTSTVTAPASSSVNQAAPSRRSTIVGRGSAHRGSISRGGDGKKIGELLSKSAIAEESSKRKWSELLRFDELRAAMEAKDVFSGFEEPRICFLPSYPRKVGTSATYSTLTERTCRELFMDSSNGSDNSTSVQLPAYKDRILSHSLPDTKQRLRNVGYWLCEEIISSTHKPVCSLYELEINRFHAYKVDEAHVLDIRQGKRALRDKTDVQEFKIKLVNLDANIWMHQAPRSTLLSTQSSRRHANANYSDASGHTPTTGVTNPVDSGSSSDSSTHSRLSSSKKSKSFSNLVDRVVRRKTDRSGRTGSTVSARSKSRSTQVSSGLGRRSLSSGSLLPDLVPVDPVNISTVFPLPSEDVLALQRKVYEVAHSVRNGFQSSGKDEDGEEAQLAYTNYRTVQWKEASIHGVTHSAITKAVNGVIHIAIKIQADKSHGGQGILCIQESDLVEHSSPVISESRPIPFDVMLTWGGKHVGYLHGDILSSL